MRFSATIFIFFLLVGPAQAQPSLTNKVLASEPTAVGKLQKAVPEAVVKAASFSSDPYSRRAAPANTAKTANQEADEPGSWRMLAASVLFMLVIAMRRQRAGKP